MFYFSRTLPQRTQEGLGFRVLVSLLSFSLLPPVAGRPNVVEQMLLYVGFAQPPALAIEAVEVRPVEVFAPAAPATRLAAADVLGQDDAGEFVISVHLR